MSGAKYVLWWEIKQSQGFREMGRLFYVRLFLGVKLTNDMCKSGWFLVYCVGWLVGWLTGSMLTRSLLSLHCLGDTVYVAWEMVSRTGDLAGTWWLAPEQTGRDIGNSGKRLELTKLHAWLGGHRQAGLRCNKDCLLVVLYEAVCSFLGSPDSRKEICDRIVKSVQWWWDWLTSWLIAFRNLDVP